MSLENNLYESFGARLKEIGGVKGVSFKTWAPNARKVFLYLSDKMIPMEEVFLGIWSLFIPQLSTGETYRFAIVSANGSFLMKSDPFAYCTEIRPKNGSVVADVDGYSWKDQKWIDERKKLNLNRPINIYEVHLGSWRKKEGDFLSYGEIALELGQYVKSMGYTHVELLPLTEHPLDESWGYQVTGFFSVTSRFGKPEEFQFFVDYLHSLDIGVILDWVPGHFPIDDFSLHRFDGTPLFEHKDFRKGFHPEWNTAIFDYGSEWVQSFLIASARFWFEKMHIDGMRVDAVSSMLYLDYGRKKGEWEPNIEGGNYNLEAIEFLTKLNTTIHTEFPGALMIAEEATSFQGVTGTLGFDLKWNMGWMHDTLTYFSVDFPSRKSHQKNLTFPLMYAFSERFLNPLSHDEVVHEKKSLLSKMRGNADQKFAGSRLLHSYFMSHPGKKMMFMGGEFGQWSEWNCKKELDWDLLELDQHSALQKMVKDLNHLYLKKDPFWKKDFSEEGYEWVDSSDKENGVISYLRKGSSTKLLIVHHFLPGFLEGYKLKFQGKKVVEIFNTDEKEYGGSGKTIHKPEIDESFLTISLPPLATLIFEVE